MTDTTKSPDTAHPWAPYVPTKDAPWNLRRVVHLHRRAGFAATWSEIQRDLADGPKASVRRLLAGKARSQGVPDDFAHTANLLAEAAVSSHDPARLKAWWLYRMYFGPDPLGERLTLLWHNHFATSNLKVDDLVAMRRQNDLFRRLARARFAELLDAVVHDPALLVWLDGPVNRKGHPNENLGRELMELFTLGIGHYTERDVKEAARALTGWTVAGDRFREDGAEHDAGMKTILGRRGRWKGDSLVRILLAHPATAQRLAARLCELFLGEAGAGPAGVKALATGLRAHDLDIGWGVETILRSRAFFAEANLATRVLDPVQYVVGPARALEMFEPPPGTLLLAEWAARLGQDLFYPPNVGGWPGGRSWISPQTMIARANFAAALVEGRLFREPAPVDALGLARRHGYGKDQGGVIDFFARLLLGLEPTTPWRDRLTAALGRPKDARPETVRRLVTLILAMPEVQLG
jgi:uncharacterized protein (DUF1800 family)